MTRAHSSRPRSQTSFQLRLRRGVSASMAEISGALRGWDMRSATRWMTSASKRATRCMYVRARAAVCSSG